MWVDLAVLWVVFGLGFVTGAYFVGSAKPSDNSDLDRYLINPPTNPPTSHKLH